VAIKGRQVDIKGHPMNKQERKQRLWILQTIVTAALTALLTVSLFKATIMRRRKTSQIEHDQLEPLSKTREDTYWKLWETDLEHMKIRWTVWTFFISISFGILGFSFQTSLTPSAGIAMRASCLLIYWFAYILYLYFHDFSQVIRTYQTEMEISKQVSLDIQTTLNKTIRGPKRKRGSTTKLLLYFGLIYTASLILFSVLLLLKP
jgi:hypothetical protein